MSTNTPDTIWQPTSGNSEFNNTGVYNIVDTLGSYLDDPSDVFIVDTGVTENLIPASIWEEDDSK